MDGSKLLITGAGGQVGKALTALYPKAKAVDSVELDITNKDLLGDFDWSGITAIINAAGYTNVDGAETPDGSKLAWQVNDQAVGNLCDVALQKSLLLVHISTAYVFDGKQKNYKEVDLVNPLGVYAKTKAAGDARVSKIPKHYIVRTDSVIGEGKNFVRTMLGLGQNGISPTVVADQIIRPTFTDQLALGIKFLIENSAEYGIYNLTNEGEPVSWADFTREIFKTAAINLEVSDITYKEYSAGKPGTAPRPLNSVLDLSKIESIGFKPSDWHDSLREYLKKELA